MFVDATGRAKLPKELFSRSKLVNKENGKTQRVLVTLESDNILSIIPETEENWDTKKVLFSASVDEKRRISFPLRKQLPQDVIDNAIIFLEDGTLKIRLR